MPTTFRFTIRFVNFFTEGKEGNESSESGCPTLPRSCVRDHSKSHFRASFTQDSPPTFIHRYFFAAWPGGFIYLYLAPFTSIYLHLPVRHVVFMKVNGGQRGRKSPEMFDSRFTRVSRNTRNGAQEVVSST